MRGPSSGQELPNINGNCTDHQRTDGARLVPLTSDRRCSLVSLSQSSPSEFYYLIDQATYCLIHFYKRFNHLVTMFSIRGWQVGPVRRFVLQSADNLKIFSVSQHNPNIGLPILSDNIHLTSPLRLSSVQTRKFHTTENREFNWAQNPIKSLQIHLLLMRLKSEWDPSFSKEDFIYGAENAAVNISWLLQTERDWSQPPQIGDVLWSV